jgi:hypothetical protein
MWFGHKPPRPQKTPEDVRRDILTGEAYDPIYFPAFLSGEAIRLMTLVDVRLLWHGKPMATKACVATWVDDILFEVRIVNADGTSRPITAAGSPAIWRACYEAGRCQGEV